MKSLHLNVIPSEVSTPNFLFRAIETVIDCDPSCGKVTSDGGADRKNKSFLDAISGGVEKDAKPKE